MIAVYLRPQQVSSATKTLYEDWVKAGSPPLSKEEEGFLRDDDDWEVGLP